MSSRVHARRATGQTGRTHTKEHARQACHRPNGEWGYSTRCHMLGRECPEAVLPDRALYLTTFSHLLIVNNLVSLSLSLGGKSSVTLYLGEIPRTMRGNKMIKSVKEGEIPWTMKKSAPRFGRFSLRGRLSVREPQTASYYRSISGEPNWDLGLELRNKPV